MRIINDHEVIQKWQRHRALVITPHVVIRSTVHSELLLNGRWNENENDRRLSRVSDALACPLRHVSGKDHPLIWDAPWRRCAGIEISRLPIKQKKECSAIHAQIGPFCNMDMRVSKQRANGSTATQLPLTEISMTPRR